MTALTVMLGVPPAALTAWHRLSVALDVLDRLPICRAHPDDWADARASVQAEAAVACSWCPVADPCRDYGRHESAEAWGGTDRTLPTKRQAKAA